MVTITVNGVRREVHSPDDTPLLYVLRNELELSGPQFGCGLAQCGACSVLLEGKEVRSCITGPRPSQTARKSPRSRACRRAGPRKRACRPGCRQKTKCTPFKQAWIEEQTPLCGFCQNGMMIKATELLEKRRDAHRRANQGSLHHVRPIGASLPLRKLYRHHRSRAACQHGHGERGGKRWPPHETKKRSMFWRYSHAPRFRQSGRRAAGRRQHYRSRRLEKSQLKAAKSRRNSHQ